MYLLKEESDGSFQAISIGDKILAGKFKNKKCVVKSFFTDENGQTKVKTDKGTYSLYTFRLEKTMPKKESLGH